MGRGWGERTCGDDCGRRRRCGLAVADYIHCERFVTVIVGVITCFSMAIRRISFVFCYHRVALGWFWFPMEGTPT